MGTDSRRGWCAYPVRREAQSRCARSHPHTWITENRRPAWAGASFDPSIFDSIRPALSISVSCRTQLNKTLAQLMLCFAQNLHRAVSAFLAFAFAIPAFAQVQVRVFPHCIAMRENPARVTRTHRTADRGASPQLCWISVAWNWPGTVRTGVRVRCKQSAP